MAALLLTACTMLSAEPVVGSAQVTSYPGSPVLTFDRVGDKITTDVVVFLSPSCNFCNSFYRELTAALKSGDLKLDGKRISVVMFARNDEDAVASRNLLCVGYARFPTVYHEYQAVTFKQFWGRPIDRGWATRTSAQVAAKHGTTEAQLAKCQSDERLGTAVALFHKVGATMTSTLPLVVVNGRVSPYSEFRRLRRELP